LGLAIRRHAANRIVSRHGRDDDVAHKSAAISTGATHVQRLCWLSPRDPMSGRGRRQRRRVDVPHVMASLTDVALRPAVLIRDEGANRLAPWTLGGRLRGMRLTLGAGHTNPQRGGSTASRHGQHSTRNGPGRMCTSAQGLKRFRKLTRIGTFIGHRPSAPTSVYLASAKADLHRGPEPVAVFKLGR
jgi:hypothetical protein